MVGAEHTRARLDRPDHQIIETMRGLMSLGTTGVALGQGIVLAGDEGAALDLAVTHDIGGDAARACLALAGFGERLEYMP